MKLLSYRVTNFRRLADVRIDLDAKTSIFVGANNSGKTSAAQIFQHFLDPSRFSIYDFSAHCWAAFDAIGEHRALDEKTVPKITLDLWFEVDKRDLHRVIALLPSLQWTDAPVGVRLEFAPKSAVELLARFWEEKDRADQAVTGDAESGPHPWPANMTEYLKRRVHEEYKVYYYVLDRNQCDAEYRPLPKHSLCELGDSAEPGSKVLQSLLRVDFVSAQRHLTDADPGGAAQNLSSRLSRFYKRHYKQQEFDYESWAALANSEARMNEHLAAVFEPTLKTLNTLGYPGFADPDLVITTDLDTESILTHNATVNYALRDPGGPVAAHQPTLPDKYNGLGFKNLIYMVVEVLDYHQQWSGAEESCPPLHLVIIEEPEAHLHAQLQQVFIRKVQELLPKHAPGCMTQFIITTHSPHILYESNFTPIRYFRRASRADGGLYSDVRNLSTLASQMVKEDRDFLVKYLKLTHCDLFFADAAVLVEGSVERLLLPLMIERVAPELRSCCLSILEVGGAFAHKFKSLIHFLGIPTLIVTDLDSVAPDSANDGGEAAQCSACMTSEANAVTSNPMLAEWIPKQKKIAELLGVEADRKAPPGTSDEPAPVCVAYQTARPVAWGGVEQRVAGRTFEDAFAYENLEWCQDMERKSLRLRVVTSKGGDSLDDILRGIHTRVRSSSFSKTGFALGLMMMDREQWTVPEYIVEGLRWLKAQLMPLRVVPPGGEKAESGA